MMNVGIYGGSFDPVHNGHVKLAHFMITSLHLDKLIVVPMHHTPLKNTDPACAAERVQMCRLAFDDPRIEVSTVETDRGGKSYTAETVNEIKRLYGDNKYYLIIGSDQLLQFNGWYRYTEILSAVTLCAVSRCRNDKKAELELFADNELREFGRVLICDFEPMEISSTQIRTMLAGGESVENFLPERVLRYIIDRGLYQ